jgi:hypothetical protein
MARSTKNSKRIRVNGVDYRWRATGNDGWISVTIWPVNGIGPAIACQFGYHETFEPNRPLPTGGPECWISHGDQIVITNRLVRRVILHAVSAESYLPTEPGRQLNLQDIESKVPWEDAVRASRGGLPACEAQPR